MDDDATAAFDQRYYQWTGSFKQCHQDFLVNEITVFKKSTWNEGSTDSSSISKATNVEVWDYYPVGSTLSTGSNCPITDDTSSSSSSPILDCRIASVSSPSSLDHAVRQQVNTTFGLADRSFPASTSSPAILVDTNKASSGTITAVAPIGVDDDMPQQRAEEDAQVLLSIPNLETAKSRLLPVLVPLLQGVSKEEETLAPSIIFWLEQLQDKAIQQIRHYPKPPPQDSQCTNSSSRSVPFGFNKSIPNRRELVTQFHQLVQYWFPFIQVDTTDDTHSLTINTTFFDLIPYLTHPVETLLALYRLRFCTARSINHNNNSVVLTLLPESTTKDIRRWIHTKLSSTCRSMKTSTKTNNTIIVQRYAQSTKSKKRKLDDTFSHTPTSSKQQHLQLLCVVQKIGLEHLRCIQTLAYALSCSMSDIGMAGIKDKCAVTTQFVTLRNVSPLRVQNAQLPPNIRLIMDNKWTTTMLSPGMLYRNQFQITLRDIQVVRTHRTNNAITPPSIQDVIQGSIQPMKRYGFVNLFGEQRLGIDTDTMPIQSYIGKAILQQDFWMAINLIIQGDPGDTCNLNASSVDERNDEEEQGKTLYTSQAITMARKLWCETQDPVAVLKVLPRDGFHRERIILKGLKRYGKHEPLAVWRCLPYHIRSFYIHAYQSYVWNSVAWERIRKVGARTVMKGDLYYDNGKLKITSEPSQVPFSSIVHPLPGTDVRYPENEIGDMYHKILQKDGIDFNAKDAPAESTAKGTYRSLHSYAHNLEWHRILGDGEEERVTLSAAKFTFELDSGCYGTVMLRQLMKPFLD